MGERKDRKTDICFLNPFFPTKLYCTSLSLFLFMYSLQDIVLFVGAPFVVGPQADHCCKIYQHCVLFLIFPNEVLI